MIVETKAAEIECIACGCTNEQACPGGCSWAAVNEESGFGLCTSCVVCPLDDLIEEGLFP